MEENRHENKNNDNYIDDNQRRRRRRRKRQRSVTNVCAPFTASTLEEMRREWGLVKADKIHQLKKNILYFLGNKQMITKQSGESFACSYYQ